MSEKYFPLASLGIRKTGNNQRSFEKIRMTEMADGPIPKEKPIGDIKPTDVPKIVMNYRTSENTQ